MSKIGNEKKSRMLGMPHGTAANRLRKNILFALLTSRSGGVQCFQCRKVISSVEDLSIEHKEPWMQADDPVESFFDLNNIAFSHLSCNVAAGSRTVKYHTAEEKREAGRRYNREWIARNRKSVNQKKRQRWSDLTEEERQNDWTKRRDKYGRYDKK